MTPHRPDNDVSAPGLARLLARLLLPSGEAEFILGDLDEEYAEEVLGRLGPEEARTWYWRMTLRSIGERWRPSVMVLRLGLRRAVAGKDLGAPMHARMTSRGGAMEGFRQDARYAWRTLLRRPSFTLVALLTIALGIGANTAVFSLANWLLFRPIPGVEHMDGLVNVSFEKPDGDGTGVSHANLQDLRDATPSLAMLAGSASMGLDVAADGQTPLATIGETVTEGYFQTLGVRPHAGRLFTSEELLAAPPQRVAVVSTGLWRTLFQGDPSAIGRTLRVNGVPYTVVGVAEDGFRGPERLGRTDLWLPISMYIELRRFPGDRATSNRDFRPLFQLVGRLDVSGTTPQAQSELRTAMVRLVAAYPDDNEIHETYVPVVREGVGLSHHVRGSATRSLGILALIVGAVLLIACTNVANLLLVRESQRRGETAVRRVVGASAGRVVRQRLTESLMLSVGGGAVGLAGSLWAMRMLSATRLWGLPEIGHIQADGRLLAFVLGASLLAGMLSGILPALLSMKTDLAGALRDSARTSTRGGRALRSGLTVAQISLSLALLIGSLLLVRTLQGLRAVDLGFDAEGVVTYQMEPSRQGYENEDRDRLVRGLLRELGQAAEVEMASVTTAPPLLGHCELQAGKADRW